MLVLRSAVSFWSCIPVLKQCKRYDYEEWNFLSITVSNNPVVQRNTKLTSIEAVYECYEKSPNESSELSTEDFEGERLS